MSSTLLAVFVSLRGEWTVPVLLCRIQLRGAQWLALNHTASSGQRSLQTGKDKVKTGEELQVPWGQGVLAGEAAGPRRRAVRTKAPRDGGG